MHCLCLTLEGEIIDFNLIFNIFFPTFIVHFVIIMSTRVTFVWTTRNEVWDN